MHLVVIGANHTSASLDLRERISHELENLNALPFPFIPLVTCNRSELYLSTQDAPKAHTTVIQYLRSKGLIDFEESLYTLFDKDVLRHLSLVSSGLSSALFGETEIQGQVRRSYEEARAAKPLSKALHSLFQQALKISKRIRNGYFQDQVPCNIEQLIETKIHDHFGTETKTRGLLIGASSINTRVAHYFANKTPYQMSLCNRTIDRGEALAHSLSMDLLPWQDLLAKIHTFDWVVSAVKSSSYVVDTQNFQQPLSSLLIDLGVPRNIDPKLNVQNLVHIEQLSASIKPSESILKDASEMAYSLSDAAFSAKIHAG